MPAGILSRNNVHVVGDRGPAMLLAHGFGCDQHVWRHVVPAFRDTHRVVLFDYVGSGRSDRAAWDARRYRTLDGYATDLLEVCAALDLREVTLVGHSVSGMIGALAARREPGRFARLVMVGPSARYLDDPPAYVGGFGRADIDALLRAMDENYLGWASHLAPVIMGNPDRPALAGELADSFCSTDPVTARVFAEATFLADNRADLPHVPTPTLVLQCRDDAVAPPSAGQYIRDHMPRATMRLLDATGHCPHLSEPAELVDAIAEWLAAPVG